MAVQPLFATGELSRDHLVSSFFTIRRAATGDPFSGNVSLRAELTADGAKHTWAGDFAQTLDVAGQLAVYKLTKNGTKDVPPDVVIGGFRFAEPVEKARKDGLKSDGTITITIVADADEPVPANSVVLYDE